MRFVDVDKKWDSQPRLGRKFPEWTDLWSFVADIHDLWIYQTLGPWKKI